jgi:hypothetical protein
MREMTYILFGMLIGMGYSNLIHVYFIDKNERD